jgi:hypothetical protein
MQDRDRITPGRRTTAGAAVPDGAVTPSDGAPGPDESGALGGQLETEGFKTGLGEPADAPEGPLGGDGGRSDRPDPGSQGDI